MSVPSSWTDDRVEVLKALWREGKSAAAIARDLGGVTRNAVIGKVHRLGLGGRDAPARPGSRRARTPRPERSVSFARVAVAGPCPTLMPSAPTPGLATAAAEPLPDHGLADMLTVGAHACRWPIGEPRDPDFSICGRPAVHGAYCAPHGALAYRPTPHDHLLTLAGLR